MSTVPPRAAGVDSRLHVLDILRGLALAGMILVHFHQTMEREVAGPEGLIAWIVWLGLEQKAWGVFAFLFGVGFALLLRRLEARNAPVVSVYLRRLAALAAFGIIAQVCFGFRILLEYAIWGLPLLLIRKWPSWLLLVTALVVVALAPTVYLLYDRQPSFAAFMDHIALVEVDTLRAAYQDQEKAAEGVSYLTLLTARGRMMRLEYLFWETYLPSNSFALFILGLLCLRRGVFDEPLQHLPLILGGMAFGFVSWGITAYARLPGVVFSPEEYLGVPSLFGLVHDQWLCLTYVGAVVLLCAWRPVLISWLSPLGTAGRMALTNYMLQIAALDYLASGYGLGLTVRPLGSVLGTAVLFGSLVAFSYLWLWPFRIGPLEWLWRCFTYLRWQPLRRSRAAPL